MTERGESALIIGIIAFSVLVSVWAFMTYIQRDRALEACVRPLVAERGYDVATARYLCEGD